MCLSGRASGGMEIASVKFFEIWESGSCVPTLVPQGFGEPERGKRVT